MITAEELIEKSGYDWGYKEVKLKEMMIEFTKMHVEMAKKEYHKVLIKQGVVTDAGIGYFDNAYSLENIK